MFSFDVVTSRASLLFSTFTALPNFFMHFLVPTGYVILTGGVVGIGSAFSLLNIPLKSVVMIFDCLVPSAVKLSPVLIEGFCFFVVHLHESGHLKLSPEISLGVLNYLLKYLWFFLSLSVPLIMSSLPRLHNIFSPDLPPHILCGFAVLRFASVILFNFYCGDWSGSCWSARSIRCISTEKAYSVFVYLLLNLL